MVRRLAAARAGRVVQSAEVHAVDIGPSELIIILLIVVVLFGVGRLGKIGGEAGAAIREFRKGLSGDDQPEKDAKLVADGKDVGTQHP